MAELIGTAEIRVDMPTDAARRAVRKFTRDANRQLQRMQREAAAVTTELGVLKAAAGDIKVKVAVTGTPAVTAAKTAVRDLKAAARDVKVKVTLDNQTRPGARAVTATLDRLKAAAAKVKVTLDDQTAAGAAAVRRGVTRLRDLSPVEINVQFTGAAGEITAARQGMVGLRTAATGTGNAFRSLATRSVAVSLALSEVAVTARDAADALDTLRDKAALAAAALRDLRSNANRAGNSLRDLSRRAESADDRLDRLGDRTLRLSGDMGNLSGSIDNANGALNALRDGLPGLTGGLRSASGAAGGGDGAGGGSGLVAALGTLAAVSTAAAAAIGTAVPVVAGIGAALAAVAPAAGVAATGILTAVTAGAALKIGLSGLDEAFKNAFDPDNAEAFNEAMKNLAPNARSFVQAVRGMAPAFKELRLDVQDRLFKGFGKSLESTGKVLLPTVRRSLVSAAGSLNAMGRGVLTTARDLGKSGALGTALKGANQGLKDFEQLPATIVQGLVQIGAAAAPAFNRLTGAARGGIEGLSRSIASVFESGRMEKAISRAASLARDLGSALGNVGRTIGNVLGAADASGAGVIQNFKAITGELAKITGSAAVQGGLRTLFETMATVGRTAAGLLGEALKAVAPVITALGPPVQTLVRNLSAGLTPVIRSLSPILTSLATNAGRLVSAFAPLLTVAGQLVGGALRGLEPVLRGVGEQAALLAESAGNLLGPALRELPKFLNPLMELFGELASVWLNIQNDVLTALQPSLERLGSALGRVARAVAPMVPLFTDLVSFGLRGFGKAAELGARAAGKLAEILAGRLASGLERIAKWVGSHRLELMQMFNAGKLAVLDFAIAVLGAMPTVFQAFRTLASTALDAFAIMSDGLVALFGDLPIVGDQIKAAAKNFDTFRDKAKDGLDKAGKKITEFSAGALPKLKNNRLEMQIDDWQTQITEAKRLLSDKNLPSKKRAELLADIKQWEKNVAQAKKSIGGVKGISRKITVTSNAKGIAGSAQGAIQSVKDRRPKISVSSNARSAAGATARALRAIPDENVYIRVSRVGLGEVARPAGATGGLYTGRTFVHRGLAEGGLVDGPGTSTSDSIYAPWVSKDEFVVNAKSTRKHLGLLMAINADRVRGAAMAAGGMVSGALGGVGGGLRGSGMDLAGGLVSGMAAAMRQVQGAARELAMTAIYATEAALQISSPSKRFAAIGKQVGAGFVKGLAGSKAKIDQTADRIAASITKAFKGTGSRTDDRLVAMVQRSNKRLQSLAGQRDAIAKKIADANKFAGDLTAKARGSGALSSLVSDQYFAPRLIASDMAKAITDVKAFGKAITTLKSKGLNKDLLRQILEMGPETGLAFAKSLAGQDKATITRFNKLNASLAKESSKLGRAGADLLYDSGKKASQGFLAGLKAQQKSIESLMLKIAKAMQKSIRHALGIHSPSTVMAEVGRQSGQGLVVGLTRQIPHVDRTMSRASDVIANGIGRPGAPGVGGARNRMAPADGAQVLHINKLVIQNRGIISSQAEMDRWLAASLQRLDKQRRLPASVASGRRSD